MPLKKFATSSLAGISLGFFAAPNQNDNRIELIYKQGLIGIGLLLATVKSLIEGETGKYELVFALSLGLGMAINHVLAIPNNPSTNSILKTKTP
jgi:hypothetical protein